MATSASKDELFGGKLRRVKAYEGLDGPAVEVDAVPLEVGWCCGPRDILSDSRISLISLPRSPAWKPCCIDPIRSSMLSAIVE